MTPLETLLNRLDRVRAGGRGYRARCPAHDDRAPSLSVAEGADGRVLLTCHAGCPPDAVLAAVGLTWSALFPDGAAAAPSPPTPHRRPSNPYRHPMPAPRRIAATYDYLDADRTLRFQVVRYVPKAFRQRRPDGRGGWIWSLAGVTPVLYRLPEVIAAVRAGRRVYLVEGERDADALAALGLTATTAPMGAGSWRDAYTQTLTGADVVLLPDADAPGRRHAEQVAQALQGPAASVRVVPLPGLPEGGDVSDWLAAGGTRAALEDLVEATPPRRAPDLAVVGVLASEVVRERVTWVWPGRLAEGKLTILDGDPGLGKSTLYVDLAAHLTRGRAWPDGAACTPGGAVIVTTEDGLGDTLRPRLEEAGAQLDRCCLVQTLQDTPAAPPRVPVIPDDLPLLAQAVQRVAARLLVIDPLMAHLSDGTNAYRDQDMRKALAPLAAFAERCGTAVLVVRHLNKSTGGNVLYRGGGSIGIIGAARIGLLAGRDPDDEELRILACAKNNLAERPASLAFRVVASPQDPAVPVVRWDGLSGRSAQDLCTPPGPPTQREAAMAWLTEQLEEGPRPAAALYEAAEAAGFSKRTLQKARARVAVTERVGGVAGDGHWVWRLRAKGSSRKAVMASAPSSQTGHLRQLRTRPAGGDGDRGASPSPFPYGEPVVAGGRDGLFLEVSEQTGRYAVRHGDAPGEVVWYPPEAVAAQIPF